ncbi:FkbM family methyltransferase [Delftia acidovorans]
MKILICGMPRSMTTWAFNAVREILGNQQLKTVWIDPGDAVAESQFITAEEGVLAKCHHYSRALANDADFIIYSYRDIRTAAVSSFRKFSSDCSTGQLNAWVQSGRNWAQVADVSLRYEQVEIDPLGTLQRLRRMLGSKFGVERLSQERDEVLLSRVDASFVQRQSAEKIDYDAQTMILPAHRTFQPPPEDLDEVEKALYLRVQHEFGPWLVEHFYVRQEDYGQALDYRLAAYIMSRMNDAVVIDVGVERGSFIDIALGAGAMQVVAFEALPRHVEHLRTHYAREARVQICAQAVSDRFGKAAFHIAVDHEDRELDYHHTLADLGDSATVVRTTRTIEVETVSLGGLFAEKKLPAKIDFLKIDTDGHDLKVLQGLQEMRPRFILAEYWDSLPETSGENLYSLADMQDWALGSGYEHCVVIRRHGALESLEWDAPWTAPGDWGNVLFIRETSDLNLVRAVVAELAPQVQKKSQYYVATVIKDCEAKEAEIRRLDNALKALRSQSHSQPSGEEGVQSGSGTPVHLITSINHRLRSFLRPRLGNLNQYAPRQLELPKSYVSNIDNENLPSISIVTPSFLQAQFLERTLDSVLAQGYKKLEYFVQDGGSTDGTVELLESYGDRLTGWTSIKDDGQSQAINIGFSRTNGEIMGWLNSDDLLMPGALHRVGEFFAENPDVDVVYGNRILVDEEDQEIGRWILPGHDDGVLSWADFVPQETLFWRRGIWNKVGGQLDESFRFAMDWDLLMRFRDAGAKMVHLPYFLGAFRIHGAQKTSSQINEIGTLEMNRLRKRAHGREVTWQETRQALLPYLLKHCARDITYRVKNRFKQSGL